MELWIRSQDKNHLVKVEEINIEIDNDGFVGIWSYGSNKYLKWYLGNYATIERTLEVLDEIQNIMMPKISFEPIVKEIYDYKEPFVEHKVIGSKTTIEEISTYVYEMPEE